MAVGRASCWVVVLFLLVTRSFGADLFVLGVEKGPSVSTDLTILNGSVSTVSITFTFIPADGTPPQPALLPRAVCSQDSTGPIARR